MANIVLNTDIFEFMGTPSDVQTTQGTFITNLITREQSDLESILGRKITSNTATNLILQHYLNCQIYKTKLFLSGVYRDQYTITALTEAGNTLTASTGYSDGGDYYLDTSKGIILRINSYWDTQPLSIKISGKYGLVNQADDSALSEINQILIEMVATKSGLWKNYVETEDGTIQTIRTNYSKDLNNRIKRYILRDY